jgi:PKD repeat protein
MSFDFRLDGDGVPDSFAVALNGTNVFSMPASLIETGVLVNSGMIDVSAFAGQDVELFLGLVGGTSSNVQLTVQDMNFYSLLPPVAGFKAMPAAGVAPLAVTFTDNSIGAITNWHWSFGDGAMTNETDGNVSHSYSTPGTNTVTLIVSGPTGRSTNTMLNLIWALNAYQGWQFQYFGCVDCPQAADDADPDGDGMSNLIEHAAGTTPTNATSTFKVAAVSADGRRFHHHVAVHSR